ncbi:DUF6746 family protein [Pseudidiomarina tainanensis]|jgi:hypothetical protein|uniref:DUF6746 family protein n=1 Tax=Pseudidiomarina tainanensis TaxID=502365 RepID=UPI001F31FB56|nr:DUF6746 family protein [Pseudidiomarina tainanensis]
MKLLPIASAVALSLAFLTSPVIAHDHGKKDHKHDEQERPDHYKGKPSENLTQALNNLREYNKLLNTELSGELTPQKMAEIHQLTYTLERALERLDDEIDEMKDVLEEVHLGSERMELDRVKKNGAKYLEASNKIVEAGRAHK